jgi:23S rRNA U2552 (ribose-2'-O)-methylase RlmE/FtsJ
MANYEKPDFWSIKAQKEGYPARSVYKLQEMDEKFGLLKGRREGLRALDLGAAPGSWSLYVLRKLSGAGFLAAIDLAPLSHVYGRPLGMIRRNCSGACGPFFNRQKVSNPRLAVRNLLKRFLWALYLRPQI